MSSSYSEVSVEMRRGDDHRRAKYNVYVDDKERKDYFTTKTADASGKEVLVGNS